jgi:hypothetical protein
MSDPRPGTEVASRLRTVAMVIAASAVGVPVVLAGLVQAVLYQLNPRGEELSGFGAYQVEVGATLLVAVIVMAIVVAWVFAALAARDRSALRYPVLVVQLQVGFAAAVIALVLLTPGLF